MSWDTYKPEETSNTQDPKRDSRFIRFMDLFGDWCIGIVFLVLVAGGVFLLTSHKTSENQKWDAWCLSVGGSIEPSQRTPPSQHGSVVREAYCMKDGTAIGYR